MFGTNGLGRKLGAALVLVGVLAAGTASARDYRGDRDNNPPGPAGGPGTNWENPPGPRGGPGASPDRLHWRGHHQPPSHWYRAHDRRHAWDHRWDRHWR